jgi:uncharacterized protein YbbK (DUF523 family)
VAKHAKPRLGISACLLGEKVRYDGRDKREDALVRALGPIVEWVPVCPELEVGMGVPREPIRLVGPPASPRLVGERSARDHTESMRRYAEERVAELARMGLAGFVTKEDSPSCGLERVRVWSGLDGKRPRRDGVGAFVRVLREQLPLLPIEEEGRLRDPRQRESFVERVLAYREFQEAARRGRTGGELAAFHAVRIAARALPRRSPPARPRGLQGSRRAARCPPARPPA